MVLAGDKGELPTVVVSINYRLGLLGLLASSEMAQRQAKNSSDVSLNNALRDMTQAVLWVKQNIASFGGDPNRITIWGQSAGCALEIDRYNEDASSITYTTHAPLLHADLSAPQPSS